MPTTDPNPPVTPVDTTAVAGATGPLPNGSQQTASVADTTVYGGGGGTDLADSYVTGTVDTAATTGGTFTPANTGATGTLDSIQGGGGLRTDANPVYRAPAGPVAGVISDTTRTDSPVTGTVLVTNKAYNKTSKVATITTDQSGTTFPVGAVVTIIGVDADLDGTATIVTAPSAGVFTFTTDKPAANIASAAVVGGTVMLSIMAFMSGTPDSYTIGAVPVTNTNVPGAPTGVTATANDDGTVTVAWTAPAAVSGAPTRGFIVESSKGFQRLAAANVTSLRTGPLDLEADFPVTFTVRALNDNGAGAKSTASAAATPKNVNFTGYAPGFSPDANTDPAYLPDGTIKPGTGGWPGLPTGVTPATGSGAGEVDVDWVLPSLGVPLTGIRAIASDGHYADVAGNATTATITGITPSASVTVRLILTNAKGSTTTQAYGPVTAHA